MTASSSRRRRSTIAASAALLGAVSSTTSAAAFIVAAPAGRQSDRAGRRPLPSSDAKAIDPNRPGGSRVSDPWTAKRSSPPSVALFSKGRNDDGDGDDDARARNQNDGERNDNNAGGGIGDAIARRLERADPLAIRRDVILVACYVLCRYLVYDIATGEKMVPGFTVQDVIYLTGTLSSMSLLGLYWIGAGLLTRLFEGRSNDALANAVTIAMCCPIWVATEHYLQFGPSDIGGPTLDASVASGFLGLASFVAVAKYLTREWR